MVRCEKRSIGSCKAQYWAAAWHLGLRDVRCTDAGPQSSVQAVRFVLIAVQNPNVTGLPRSELATCVRDAGWSSRNETLTCRLKAGGTLLRMGPRRTSPDCLGCGERVPKNLPKRRHACPSGGAFLGLHHDTVISILREAIGAA